METIGLGVVAMAASPRWRASSAWALADALATTEAMRQISVGEHPVFHIPTLDDRGSPVGWTCGESSDRHHAVARHRHRRAAAGAGQVGAGVVRAPLGCFTAALEALTS